MAILFRQEQEKSPFAEALKKLIDSGEGKLILSSGYFAYKTQLVDWIVDAASKSKLNEIVIIAGYINPSVKVEVDSESVTKTIREYHANVIDFYKYLVKLLAELPTLSILQQPELLHHYMPWSENIQATCAK